MKFGLLCPLRSQQTRRVKFGSQFATLLRAVITNWKKASAWILTVEAGLTKLTNNNLKSLMKLGFIKVPFGKLPVF